MHTNWVRVPEYNSRTGISTGSIGTKYGLVSANSKISAEDSENGLSSAFIGCALVERRCHMEEARRKMNVMLERYRGAQAVYESLSENVGLYQPARIAANIARNYKHEYEVSRETYHRLKDGDREYSRKLLDEKRNLRAAEEKILAEKAK